MAQDRDKNANQRFVMQTSEMSKGKSTKESHKSGIALMKKVKGKSK